MGSKQLIMTPGGETLIYNLHLFIMQIADFGLSRDVSEDDVYVSHGGMIPIKWTAPEVLV